MVRRKKLMKRFLLRLKSLIEPWISQEIIELLHDTDAWRSKAKKVRQL